MFKISVFLLKPLKSFKSLDPANIFLKHSHKISSHLAGLTSAERKKRKRLSGLSNTITTGFFLMALCGNSYADISDDVQTEFDSYNKLIQLPNNLKSRLLQAGNTIFNYYNSSVHQEMVSMVGAETEEAPKMQITGSIGYGFDVKDPASGKTSDLDINFYSKVCFPVGCTRESPTDEEVARMKNAAEIFFKNLANTYRVGLTNPGISFEPVDGSNLDIDATIFLLDTNATGPCKVANKCSNILWGKGDIESDYHPYKSERLIFSSLIDSNFGPQGTKQRKNINTVIRSMKIWRNKIYRSSPSTKKIPNMALYIAMYESVRKQGKPRNTLKGIKQFTDQMKSYFPSGCKVGEIKPINTPFFQQERNVISDIPKSDLLFFCNQLNSFSKTLAQAISAKSKLEAVRILKTIFPSYPDSINVIEQVDISSLSIWNLDKINDIKNLSKSSILYSSFST